MADLSRSIGLARGSFMMLNIVLGAGLLTLPGLAAQAAGAAAPFVWLICALVAVPLLAVFAILGRNHPSSGGIPAWVQTSLGRWAYVPTILLFLGAVSVGLPSIAITGGHYAKSAFGLDPHVFALVLILFATAVNLLSAEKAGRVNAAIASLLLFVLIAMALLGISLTGASETPRAASAISTLDVSTFGMTFMMIFFAFTGWEVAANLAGEFKDPERTFPRAIALSFIGAVALYVGLSIVVLSAGPEAYNEAPFATIFGDAFGALGAGAVSIIAILLVFANLSAAIWAVSRLVYAASRDAVLPPAFSHLSNGTPLRAVFATSGTLLGVAALAKAGLFSLATLLEMAGQNFLLLYGAAAICLLRLSSSGWHRALALLSIALVGGLLFSRPVEALNYPAALIVVGLAIVAAQTLKQHMNPGLHRRTVNENA